MSSAEERLRASVAYYNSVMKSTQIQPGSKVLIVEPPDQTWQRYPWDESTKQQFHLNDAEVDQLERGAVLWHGSTAFMVERIG